MINERIKEISERFCPDYPGIKECDEIERLYAIESALDGLTMANNDLHSVIKALRKDLPKDLEYMPKPFQEWMRGQTVPLLEDGKEGYYLADYVQWLQGKPVID